VVCGVSRSRGLEEPVLPDAPDGEGYARFWALVDDRLYFLNSQNRRRPSVDFFSFATRQTTRAGTLPRAAWPWESGLAISPDRRRVLVALEDEAEGRHHAGRELSLGFQGRRV
jgi:hypothetical protein